MFTTSHIKILLFKFNLRQNSLYFQNESKEKHVLIKMPKEIKIFKVDYVYTVWEFISEFGGWVGVLFGYCIVDIADALTELAVYMYNNVNIQ